jgi:outer membrane protein OmpA-like peptidoglycan-associated protein
MKALIILNCLFSFSVQVYSQNLKIKQAELYFNSYRYAEATPIYEELILKDQLDINAHDSIFRHAAISADKSRNFDFENNVLARLSLSTKYTFEDAYAYFQLSTFLGLYEKAKEILKSPTIINSTDARKNLLNNYNDGAVWAKFNMDTSRYKIEKQSFNSGKGDFNAIYHPDGIVFTSARDISMNKSIYDKSSYLNLYQFSIKDGNVNRVKFLGDSKHDGTSFYDSINKIWYFSKNLEYNNTTKLSTTGIFIYDENTKKESAFLYNNPIYFLAQPFLSEDSQTLWFSSDKEGGNGMSDIWYSKRTNTGWGEPINAGNVINTSQNEMFPYINNSTLYFSSNGHAGLGGLDLFSANIATEAANTISNLGANLNSNGDDFSIVLDKSGKKGYFSSNRTDFKDNIYSVIINNVDFVFIGNIVADIKGDELLKLPIYVKKNGIVTDTLYPDAKGKFEFKGDKNSAYAFEINDNEFLPLTENYSTIGKTESDTTVKSFNLISKYVNVVAKVTDDVTKLPLPNTTVKIKDDITGEVLTYVSDENGEIETKLLRDKDFSLTAAHTGYIDNNKPFKTEGKDVEMNIPVKVEKIKVGTKVEINTVSYDFNKASLKAEGKIELDKIVAFLKENPTVTIELSSHTDSRGSEEQNMMLSKKRSESSVNYLISKGVKSSSIVSKWFGESMLLNKCKDGVSCSEAEHTMNRRTEIKVLSVL